MASAMVRTTFAIEKKVKRSWASSSSPAPRVRATMALPPVPSMKPTVARNMGTGQTKFTAASAVEPAQLETKRPSVIT